MQNYYKYLPISAKDEAWGLSVLNAGCTRILPHSAYPVQNHPSNYNFNREKGRVLQEYQVIYITRGEGVFESESGKSVSIGSGTIILLFPGERHRYKPSDETGWDEYWVGFSGKIIDQLKDQGFLNPKQPTVGVGLDERLLGLFLELIEETKEEKLGYQPLISGAVLHLLGYLQVAAQKNNFEGKDIEDIVKKAQLLFRATITEKITPEQVAEETGVSYSRFRKMFKSYTGLAPGQYQIQLKIQRAKEMLLNPNKSIKEIAYDLKFESSFYFSKLFKEKTGFTPQKYRRRGMGL